MEKYGHAINTKMIMLISLLKNAAHRRARAGVAGALERLSVQALLHCGNKPQVS
jgi:hypothetical protein